MTLKKILELSTSNIAPWATVVIKDYRLRIRYTGGIDFIPEDLLLSEVKHLDVRDEGWSALIIVR